MIRMNRETVSLARQVLIVGLALSLTFLRVLCSARCLN